MTLALMIGAYSAYAKFAVPVIEGPKDQVRRGVAVVPKMLPEKQDNKSRLFKLLPNNAWELGSCKTLFTNSGTLLFQEMTRVDDEGTYTLTPFTMIMNDHESGTAFAAKLDPAVPPTVLRCGEAQMKFDGPIALTGNSSMKMRSANLNGDVTIFRPSPTPLKDETVKIITQNVQVNTQRILTFSEVAFAFGPHKGSGKNLSIDLTHLSQADQSLQKDLSSVKGISRVELTQLDRLLIDPSALASSPTSREAQQPAAAAKNGSVFNATRAPLEIVCSGPFVFDYDKRSATFQHKVYGKQLDSFGDNLSCETLTIAFDNDNDNASKNGNPINPSNPVTQTAGPKIKYLSAIGTTDQPAVIIANSRRTKVTGDELRFDSTTNEVVASSTDTVTVIGPEINARARTLKYELTDDQTLGNLQAVGPGEFFRRAEDKRGNLFARWKRSLTIGPHDNNQKLITIDGTAEILVQDDTQITADRLNIVLHELKIADKVEYRPAEVFSDQRVTILSPNLDGVAGKLVARWPDPNLTQQLSLNGTHFRQHQPPRDSVRFTISNQGPGAIAQRLIGRSDRQIKHQVMRPQLPQLPQALVDQLQPKTKLRHLSNSPARPNFAPLQLATYEESAESASAQSTGQADRSVPNKRASLKQFIRFKADSVELELDQEGDQLQLADLQMDGNIVIHQLPEKGSTKPPLRVAGNSIRLVPQGDQIFRILVAGKQDALATVNSEGLAVSGENIHLDQQANKVWVAGIGIVNIKQSAADNSGANPIQLVSSNSADASAPNQLAPQGDFDVEFAGGMVFDGSKIYFERNVMMTSHGDPTSAERSVTKTLSQALSVELASAVDFSQLSSGKTIGDVKMNEMVLVNHITEDQRVFKDHAGDNDPRMNSADTPIIFQNETFDRAGQLTQQRRVVVPRVTINAATNTVYAVGPGKIFTHQKGTEGLANIGGMDQLGSPPGQSQPNKTNKEQLNYLQVNFDDRLVADLGQKQLNITGNIRTLFSPAKNFQFSLDPDTTQRLPAGAIRLKCENMQLSQWLPTGSDKPQNEIIATGNAHITSLTFEATAQRVSYNDGNDQMVVEGTARSPANLWYRQTPRGQRQHLTGNKLIYHPSTGSAEMQGVRNLNLNIGK